VAGRLMRALIRDAKLRGLKRMEGYVLGANSRMLDFVRKLGFRAEFDPNDPSVRVVRLDLQAPPAEH
jgi:acetyltransferase